METPSPWKISLSLLCCLLILGPAIAQIRPVHAQFGAVLERFAVPQRTTAPVYFPNGLAFDGTNLWYADPSDTAPDIFQSTTTGTLLRILPLVKETGGLAWDGTNLWGATFSAVGRSPLGSVFQISVGATPTVLKTIELKKILAPDNECGFIDGLDFDTATNTLWVSPDPGCTLFPTPTGFVYHIDLNGNLLSRLAFNFGISGVQLVGQNLYIVQRTGGNMIHKITLNGQIIASFIPATLSNDQTPSPEDLAFDAVTFAPTCALWANERGGGLFVLTAYQIDCP